MGWWYYMSWEVSFCRHNHTLSVIRLIFCLFNLIVHFVFYFSFFFLNIFEVLDKTNKKYFKDQSVTSLFCFGKCPRENFELRVHFILFMRIKIKNLILLKETMPLTLTCIVLYNMNNCTLVIVTLLCIYGYISYLYTFLFTMAILLRRNKKGECAFIVITMKTIQS